MLYVKYVYPWEKNIEINLANVVDIDFEKGFYDLFSDKTRGGLFVFPKYCADRLILKVRDNKEIDTIYVQVNTRIFEFNKVVKYLQLGLKK